MSRRSTLSQAAALAFLLGIGAAAAQVTVINMIPNSRSGETSQDSEPNLAVNPTDPTQMAGSAFTPDPNAGVNAPIYVSVDGGATWTLNSIVPGGNNVAGTGDITLRFGGTSNVLYAGILRGDSSLRLNTLRTMNFTQPNVMTVLVDRLQVDQPYIQATTVMGGPGTGLDRVYYGINDFNAPNGKTATIDISLDGIAATPPSPSNFTSARIEKRNTPSQDHPPIRTVAHPDGTVYGVFYGRRSVSGQLRISDLTVVRDDNWASDATPFEDLVDPNDGLSGMRVLLNVNVPFINAPTLGQERLGSALSIAVDPTNSSRVYVSYADFPNGVAPNTLHVLRSDDRGQTWTADLLTLGSAINPALAVNTHGKVGIVYQQVTGSGANQRWQTHLRRSTDFGANWDDMTLANVPASTPAPQFLPYIGDYVHLMAVGKDFYGVFSANNTPNAANFPQGVTYQRNANFGTQQLLGVNGVTPVSVSIDPYFFHVVEVPRELDFYVRDWTDNPASGDTGLEPSTHPAFYLTSDVWNRRGSLPGSFPNDQPENEDAGNGAGIIGDNWAMARIRRNAGGSANAETVTAHFLVSKFGTGSNYVDNSMADPDVTLPPGDPTVTFNVGETGPKTTPAYYWHLNPVNSTHLCMAVEISTPSDPFVAPSLLGNTPGWWTGTDLRVLLDNNKAQRNLGLSTTPARGEGNSVYYGIVHNGATFRRDMKLRYRVDPVTLRRMGRAEIELVGQERVALASDGILTLRDMQPGENRWVGLSFTTPSGSEGEILAVTFEELVADKPVDGFGMGVKLASDDEAIRAALRGHQSIGGRLYHGFRVDSAKDDVEGATALLAKKPLDEADYLGFVRDRIGKLRNALAGLGGDPFGSAAALETLERSSGAPATAMAHAAFLNRLDSLLTLRQLEEGDEADLLQNVRFQRDLYVRVADLAGLPVGERVRGESRSFLDGYQSRRLGNADYERHVTGLLDSYEATASALKKRLPDLGKAVDDIREALGGSRAGLQKAHRAFLLALHGLEP